MKCELAASLLHKPKILFLDEPTIGLDAVTKLAVRDFVKVINKKWGTTVILTTHDMTDIEALTNKIILIGRGQILYNGTFTAIKEKYDNEKIINVDFKHEYDKIKNISGLNTFYSIGSNGYGLVEANELEATKASVP